MGTAPAPRKIAFFVTFATLAVFGALVAVLGLRVRGQLRAAVLQQQAGAIGAVAAMELNAAKEKLFGPADTDPMPALFSVALESSRLGGVMLVQLFDAEGKLRSALPDVARFDPAERWWTA